MENLFEKSDGDKKFAELYALMLYKKLISIFDVPADLKAAVAVHLLIFKQKESEKAEGVDDVGK